MILFLFHQINNIPAFCSLNIEEFFLFINDFFFQLMFVDRPQSIVLSCTIFQRTSADTMYRSAGRFYAKQSILFRIFSCYSLFEPQPKRTMEHLNRRQI